MNRFKDILDSILDKIEQISDSISKKGVQSKENVCKTILEDKDFEELFQEIRNFLGEISERKFEEKLTNFVVTTYRPEAENEINRIKEIMRKDIFSQLNPVIKFVLFFILFTYHRRFTNISKLEELFREYEYKVLEEPQCDYFKNKVDQEIIEKYMKHLKAMYLALTGKSHQIIKGLKIIKEVLNDNSENSLKHEGIVHNYVWILTTCLEDDECYRMLRSDKELDYEDEISTALGKINEIISSEHKYPKFYATYGRLISIVAYRGFFEQEIKDNEDLVKDVLNKFKEAKENIRKAIDMEKPEEIDYDLRIHKYYSYLMKIDYYKYMVLTTSKIAYIEKDIDSIKQERLRMIETLGVFSGFLGFILTALFSVSSGRIVLKNILSIDLMLLGSTISFFSFIHMLVLEKTRDKVLMALLILGLAIITISLIIL